MAKRFRRPQVVWLPPDINNRLGQAPVAATSGTNSALGIALIAAPGGVGQVAVTTLFPIVKDEPQNLTGLTETLSDFEGSAYRLRRIVGKIFVALRQTVANSTAATANNLLVTAGFIILRVDDGGQPMNSSAPTYDVQAIDQARDPWIWRRTWALTNIPNLPVAAGATDSIILGNPSNADAQSMVDGPHVDAKTARIVSDEERLFLVITAAAIDGTEAQTTNGLFVTWDLRVLASMRKSSGNRRNASR